jgi:hypothetical protein
LKPRRIEIATGGQTLIEGQDATKTDKAKKAA